MRMSERKCKKNLKLIVLTSSSMNALLVWSVIISLVYKYVCEDVNYCNIKKREKMLQERKEKSILSREDQHRKIKWRRRDVKLFLILLDMLKRNSFYKPILCFLPPNHNLLSPPFSLSIPFSKNIFTIEIFISVHYAN